MNKQGVIYSLSMSYQQIKAIKDALKFKETFSSTNSKFTTAAYKTVSSRIIDINKKTANESGFSFVKVQPITKN